MALKDDIILLYTEYKYSKQQIADELGCSRATVDYHVNPEAKQKTKDRMAKLRGIEKDSRPVIIKEIKAKVKREKAIKAKPVKPELKPQPLRMMTERPLKRQDRIFKTKELRLDEKIPVKLGDRKNTTVYALPGFNLEELRIKYLGS